MFIDILNSLIFSNAYQIKWVKCHSRILLCDHYIQCFFVIQIIVANLYKFKGNKLKGIYNYIKFLIVSVLNLFKTILRNHNTFPSFKDK